MIEQRGGKMRPRGVRERGKEGEKPEKGRLKGERRDTERRRGSQNWQPCPNCQSPVLSLGGCDRASEPREK